MFPTFLTQALYALGGVFILLGVYVFHHYSQEVRRDTNDRLVLLLSKESTRHLVERINQDEVPDVVVRDFANDVLSIGEPRRAFRVLLVLSPITGIFLLGSALLGSLEAVAADVTSWSIQTVELGAYLLFLVGIGLTIWCGINIVRLGTELS